MNRALIVFAKLPKPGEVKTRLGAEIGMEKAAEVYAELARHAFDVAGKLASEDVQVYVFYTPGATEREIAAWVGHPFRFVQQEGHDLGERMYNAFLRTLREEATRAMIVGTDVPGLDVGIVRSGFESLKTSDVVLGPSSDGGYYLLGLKSVERSLFEGIAWSTHTVYTSTLERIRDLRLLCSELMPLPDLDTARDYESYLRARTPDPL